MTQMITNPDICKNEFIKKALLTMESINKIAHANAHLYTLPQFLLLFLWIFSLFSALSLLTAICDSKIYKKAEFAPVCWSDYTTDCLIPSIKHQISSTKHQFLLKNTKFFI